jgi:beta-lactam-binding protein with PASTA domain
VPNLRGKKPKAARRALAAADCTAGKAKKSKKRRKKKKVLSQNVPPGTSISDTTPVGFKVSKLKK